MVYERIGELPGAGHSSTRHDYLFVDEAPFPGANYYRIKQVDVDGEFTYSPVQVATLAEPHHVTVYPNPARDMVRIAGLETPENALVEVFNAAGEQLPFPSDAWDNGLLDLSTLPKGLYLVRIGDQVARVVKE